MHMTRVAAQFICTVSTYTAEEEGFYLLRIDEGLSVIGIGRQYACAV